MKTKSLAAGLIMTVSTMFVAVGTVQAARCYHIHSGWHMVSRYCEIRPAATWQQYFEGGYTQPITTGTNIFFLR